MRIIPRISFITAGVKVPWKWLAAILLTGILICGYFVITEKITSIPPAEAVSQSLAKTQNAQSYRYSAIATRTLEGKEVVISDVTGERNQKGVHIKGNLPIIKTEVEVYQFPDAMYRRDSLTKGWLVVPAKGRVAIEQLISEINPLGAFHFNENIEVQYVGKEKVNKYNCRVYEVMSRGQNKFLELYWEDFNYRLWIDKKEGFIRKAEISAEHRDNSQHLLKVSIFLTDYNEIFEINPPQT